MCISKPIPLLLMLLSGVLTTVTAQWTPLPTGTTTKYESIQFFDAMNGVVASWGKVLLTSDAGEHWTVVNVSGVRDIDFANTAVGYVAGVSGSAIKKTVNGGQNWTALTPINSNSLWGVSVVDASTVFVCGTGRVVWKSTNGGLSFTAINLPSGPTDLVVDLHFASASTGVALGQSGGVWKTTNGGQSWSNNFSLTSVSFTDLYFVTPQIGYAVGSEGAIIKTTNGGDSWTALSSGSQAYLQYVHFFDANNGITVGYGGVILRTTNGGATWFSENSGLTDNFFCCILLSPDVALIGGENGVMYKNSHLSAMVAQHEAPQNTTTLYPNPATDRVSVRSEQPMKNVKIFDILGRKTAEMANPGLETQIDLSDYAPGTYFVQVETTTNLQISKLSIQPN